MGSFLEDLMGKKRVVRGGKEYNDPAAPSVGRYRPGEKEGAVTEKGKGK